MRIMEILLYQPDDPTDLENDADQEMMRQLANRFTARRGLVKALTGFGSGEQQSGDSGPSANAYPPTSSGVNRVAQATVDAGVSDVRALGHEPFEQQPLP